VAIADFNVLKRFHPAETRYYIDFSTNRRSAQAEAAATGGNGVRVAAAAKAHKARSKNQHSYEQNRLISLMPGYREPDFLERSNRYKVWNAAKKILQNDFTVSMPRISLLNAIMAETGLKRNGVQPTLSDFIIKLGLLKQKNKL
jgi:hypothetical protein